MEVPFLKAAPPPKHQLNAYLEDGETDVFVGDADGDLDDAHDD